MAREIEQRIAGVIALERLHDRARERELIGLPDPKQEIAELAAPDLAGQDPEMRGKREPAMVLGMLGP